MTLKLFSLWKIILLVRDQMKMHELDIFTFYVNNVQYKHLYFNKVNREIILKQIQETSDAINNLIIRYHYQK